MLWLALLLAVIAGSLITTARTGLRLSRNLMDSARAEALADGGVYLAVAYLAARDPAIRWAADGAPHVVELNSSHLEITVQDAAGRIDLNAAPPALLAGLFRAAGVEPPQAETLAARIADWRDRDEDAQPNGAEQKDYDAAGIAVRVGNAPFLTPGEILRIPGIDMALYERIDGAVTVWSRQRGLDPTSASQLTLSALPGMDAALAGEVVAERAAAPDPSGAGVYALLPAEARLFLARGDGRVLHVLARAETAEGGVFVREAVIEPRPGADPPFAAHAWRPALVPSASE